MEQKKDHATTSYAFPRTSVTFILTSWSCIPLEVPFGENFDLLVRVVSLGEAHTLAIAADNKILAWGRNTEKQVSPLCEQQKVVSPFEIDLFATVGVVDSSGAGTTTVLSAKEAKTSPDRRTSSSPKLLIKEVFAREDHNIVLAKQVLHGRSSASRKPPASKAAVKKDDPAAPRFLGSPDVDHDHVDGNEALTMATKNATRNARSYPGVVAPRRRGPSAFVGDEELSKDLPREQDAHDVEQEFVPQEGSAAVAPPVPMDVDDRTSSAGTGRVSSPPRQKRKISPRDEDGLEEDARRRRGGGSSRRTVTLVDSDGNLLSGASDNGDSDEDLDPFERTDRREGSSAASSSAVSSASDMIMLDQDPNPTDAVMRDRSASSAASDHPFPRGQSDLLPRQYSRGCGSTTSRHITLFTKTEKTRRDQSIQKILIPGAAGNIQFYALENSFFGEAVDRLTAEATNLSAELAQFSTALTGTFRCPSVLSSSFVFRGLQNQKLDVDNYLEGTARLWNVMVLARATVGTVSGTSAAATTTPPQTPKTPAPPSTGPELQALELCLAIEWVQAIYAGLTTLQPQCLLARDQLRCLLVYLLAPVWRSVGELLPLSRSSGEDSGLEREPSFDRLGSLKDLTKMGSREKGGGTVLGGKGGGAASSLQSGTNSTKTSDTATLRLIESTDRKRNSELVRCFKLLAKTIMFLSKTAKRKFCEMIQEELSVVAVTERLLPNLQCMARAVFHTRGAFEERRVLLPTNEQAFVLNIQDSVWHCVGLFDMVYAACYTPWLAKHKIPKSAFHLECLLDKKKPQQQGFFHAQESTETLVSPDADYHLFSQYCAKKAILVNNLEAVSLDPLRDNEFCCLPSEMMSFIAHPHLCPTVYKQKVLEFENDFDHRQVQQAILTRLIQSGRLHPGQQIPAQQLAELMCAVLDVRRSNIVEDTFRGIGKFNDLDLVKKLKVTFVGEEGVDDGGLTKELYNLLSVELFNPQYGMFVEVEGTRATWFNLSALDIVALNDFTNVGKILGLAVYNNVSGIHMTFPRLFWKKLVGEYVSRADLESVYPSHVTSIQAILDWRPTPPDASMEEANQQFEDVFVLDFTFSYTNVFDAAVTVELCENGANRLVNFENRFEFVELLQNHLLNKQVKEMFDAVKDGFRAVCRNKIWETLNSDELELLICGERVLDFEQLRLGTSYMGYSGEEPYILEFWAMVKSWGIQLKKEFLHFVTGSDIPPVGGLKELRLKIQKNGTEPTRRLPTSSTCYNILLLPEYSGAAKMEYLLRTAIGNAEGFGMQ